MNFSDEIEWYKEQYRHYPPAERVFYFYFVYDPYWDDPDYMNDFEERKDWEHDRAVAKAYDRQRVGA